MVEGMAALVLIDAALIQGSRCANGATIHPMMMMPDGEPEAKKAKVEAVPEPPEEADR